MVFDRDYDMSLWLMASGRKREDIIKFIESIPDELVQKMKNILWLYRCYLVGNIGIDDVINDDKYKLNDSVKTLGDMIYWYSLDMETGSLDIGESIDDSEEHYDTFQITLYPLKRKHYMNLENFGEHLLGDVSYNFSEEIIDDEIKFFEFDYMNFNLFRLPFGIMLLRSGETSSYYKDGRVEKNRYNLVSIRDIPRDYNITDLRNKYVRSRKINKNSK